MTRPAPPDQEELLLRTRSHPRALVLPLLVLLTTLAAAGFGAGRVPDGEAQPLARAAVAAVAGFVVLRWSVAPWLRWVSRTLVVTDRRVTVETGLLRRTSRGVPLSRVADVALVRSVGQRLVGSGTLVVETAGERGLVLRDVPRARAVARQLSDLLEDPR